MKQNNIWQSETEWPKAFQWNRPGNWENRQPNCTYKRSKIGAENPFCIREVGGSEYPQANWTQLGTEHTRNSHKSKIISRKVELKNGLAATSSQHCPQTRRLFLHRGIAKIAQTISANFDPVFDSDSLLTGPVKTTQYTLTAESTWPLPIAARSVSHCFRYGGPLGGARTVKPRVKLVLESRVAGLFADSTTPMGDPRRP
ncbi:hypothetical protein HUJ04_012917 [Dendroctonus ponderosae]|nr:hypothetical protein HUJ04_012917 [Dendroctonus ponderosae]